MKPRNARIALVYDFDGTLAPGTMQEQSFLPAVGLNPESFWTAAKTHAKQHDMDEILAYMELMLKRSSESGIPSTRAAFKAYGRKIKLFEGVDTWFNRCNRFAALLGCRAFHYVISSGNRETIEGTVIAKHFRRVFASCFRYNENGVAVWPALAVNYTNKAHFLFRINKGIENAYDNTKINAYMPEEERPVPFRNFIYIGDGDTDIPAMKTVTYQGGRSIIVYPSGKRGAKTEAHKRVVQQRADIAVPADYRPGSLLDGAVQAAIREIAARHSFERSDTSPRKGKRPPK